MSLVKNVTGLADVAAIQTDLGNPSTRINFQSIETMIGVPDVINSCLDDILRTGFNSSEITSGSAGSVMEMLKYICGKVAGL